MYELEEEVEVIQGASRSRLTHFYDFLVAKEPQDSRTRITTNVFRFIMLSDKYGRSSKLP